MSEQRKLTFEDGIKNSNLSYDLQKAHIEFCRSLQDNGFSIEPETGDDGVGWMIVYMNECVGHTNYADTGIWIDTCDFGGTDSADNALKETTWVHVRTCEHFNTSGKQCGCGRQPGFNRMLFGKEYENLCFANLEFMNPDVETLENIKKLLLLFKQNRNNTQCTE